MGPGTAEGTGHGTTEGTSRTRSSRPSPGRCWRLGVAVDRGGLADGGGWGERPDARHMPAVVALDGDDLPVGKDLGDDPDVRAVAGPGAVEDGVARCRPHR